MYNKNQQVILTISEPGNIYYTLNGDDPTTSSNLYSGPITVDSNTIIKYLAVDMANNLSPIYTETYKIDKTPPTASATPSGNYYNIDQLVTLSMNEAGNIYYTLNGDDPTTSSNLYSGPISVASDTTIKYLAIDLANNFSPIYTEIYNIDTIPPTASANPSGGTYNANTIKPIVLSMDEPGKIYYTTNGNNPTTSSKQYTGPIPLSSNTTVKYLAVDMANNYSPIYTEIYNIDIIPPHVTSSDPSNYANNVPVSKVIKITFSEPIISGNTYNTITLKNNSGTSVSITKTISDNILTITPNLLSAGINYILTLPFGSITDQNGNSLSAYSTSFTTTPPPAPDLIITYIYGQYSGGSYSPPMLNNIQTTMENQGTASASGFYVNYYLSTDPNISTSDTYIGQSYVSSLGAGSSTTITPSFNIPGGILGGNYYIGAIVDATSLVKESNENNNAKAGNIVSVIYIPKPDLTINSLTVDIFSDIPGWMYVDTQIDVNPDSYTIPDFYVHYYLYRTSNNALVKDLGNQIITYSYGLMPGLSTSGLASDYYYIKAVADSTNLVAETNENNNEKISDSFYYHT